MAKRLVFLAASALLALPALAQQTGSIAGTVTSDGAVLPGVAVEASSNVLPRPRATTTLENGTYVLPQLPPGEYTVSFNLSGMATTTRRASVLLDQQARVDAEMSPEALTEEIEVVAEASLIDPTSAEVKSAIGEQVIELLPVGQEYRDLVKLAPGVQFTNDNVRGPSAGGSGQDNVYQFDGVNVTLPLFGTLSAEPSSHDIAQMSLIKGGARAVDFNRAGGFTMDSVSKSGTNDWNVEASYQIQTAGMTDDLKTGSSAEFDRDRDWITLGVGGPLWREHLLFYGSYYRPTIEGDNRENLYGDVPDHESDRDELFGKLTWTPIDSLLVNGSYRTSDREVQGDSVGGVSGAISATAAGSTAQGFDTQQDIAILEGSWVATDRSFLSFKYTDYALETSSLPLNVLDFPIRIDGTVDLDVANLERQGLFTVPRPVAGNDAYNAFVGPLIDRYGYLQNGARVGGGEVGVASQIDDNDFFRESAQVGYDHMLELGGTMTHELHVGYQWYRDEEDLERVSNGWGLITAPSAVTFGGQPVAFVARFQQQSLEGDAGRQLVPTIHSEYESNNLELNDNIKWGNWSFNAGVLLSNDTLYGQGLREASGNVSGFAVAPGHKYEMYDIDWDEMVSPRLGATWAYNQRDTVFASIARYYPAASSLPRAASWDRNLAAIREAYFDVSGNFIGSQAVASSSGKFFDDDLDPRRTDEFILGTTRHVGSRLDLRAYGRYRYGTNFWEDTNNDARLVFDPPPGVPRELYIPDLAIVRAEIGGSSYVIAELDGAFTKFYEAAIEGDWRGDKTFIRGSYVWSHYYGNFDQDNTTTLNDQNIFIGSSNLADGRGAQIWDHKYGNLNGDRRHLLKLYGYYQLPWNASVGGFAIYQSGQPWEEWDRLAYTPPPSTDTIRFAEAAGSNETDDHYQLDLNYTQDFPFGGDRYNVQLALDLFNVFDKQTGYNVEPRRSNALFGQPRSFYDPRRLQLAVRFRM